MANSRANLAAVLEAQAGAAACRILNPGDGWPSHIEVMTSSGSLAVAAYLAPITKSFRGRDDKERRAQNPGQYRPIRKFKKELLTIIGLEDRGKQWVLIGWDAIRRVDGVERNSYFVRQRALDTAAVIGWAAYLNASKEPEPIVVFAPVLLPIFIEGVSAAMWPPATEIQRIVQSTGMLKSRASSRDIDRGLQAIRRLKPEPIPPDPKTTHQQQDLF